MKAVLLRSKAIKLRLQFEPDNFQFTKPSERGEILFSKGFFYLYRYSQTTSKSQNPYTLVVAAVAGALVYKATH